VKGKEIDRRRKKGEQRSSCIRKDLLRERRKTPYHNPYEPMQASMARTNTAQTIQVNYSSLIVAGIG
jgi:hypothetical protein